MEQDRYVRDILASTGGIAQEVGPRQAGRYLMAAGLQLMRHGWGEAEAYEELRALLARVAQESRMARQREQGHHVPKSRLSSKFRWMQ